MSTATPVFGVKRSSGGNSDFVGRRVLEIQDGGQITGSTVLITLLVLQIHMSFQKQYRGLRLCTKHLNLQQSWPTLPRVENPRWQPTNWK